MVTQCVLFGTEETCAHAGDRHRFGSEKNMETHTHMTHPDTCPDMKVGTYSRMEVPTVPLR